MKDTVDAFAKLIDYRIITREEAEAAGLAHFHPVLTRA